MDSPLTEQTPPAEAPPPAKKKAAAVKRVSTQKQPERKKAKIDAAALPAETVPPKALVLSYMRQQNRPFNAQLIFDNLKRAIKKPILESLLEELVAEGFLVSKDLGKTRVSQLRHSGCVLIIASLGSECCSFSPTHEKLPFQSESLKHRLAAMRRRQEARAREAALASLRARVADAEAELQKKRNQQEEACSLVSAAEAAATEHLHAKLHAAWATRKRLCQELLRLLAERTQANDRQLQEELGLERDEDFIPPTAYASYD
ncbi:hypothetical protein Efla_005295 [Eimeria flavescens]